MLSLRTISIIGEIFLLSISIVGLTVAIPEMIYYAPPLLVIIFVVGVIGTCMGITLIIWRMQ
jgi:hypothetical protein